MTASMAPPPPSEAVVVVVVVVVEDVSHTNDDTNTRSRNKTNQCVVLEAAVLEDDETTQDPPPELVLPAPNPQCGSFATTMISIDANNVTTTTTDDDDASSTIGGKNNNSTTTKKNTIRILHVQNQLLADAKGNKGSYSGPLMVDTGLPHGSGGCMQYFLIANENENENENENDDKNNDNSNTMVDWYQGGWQHGYWHATGHCRMRNGDEYRGDMEYHERQGHGVYTWAPTTTRRTTTKQSSTPTTKNSKTKKNDDHPKEETTTTVRLYRTYQGSFCHNQRQGHGKYTWKTTTTTTTTTNTSETTSTSTSTSSSTYVGDFCRQGQRSGHGIYTSPTLCYTGDWKEGKYHGQGVLVEVLEKETATATATATAITNEQQQQQQQQQAAHKRTTTTTTAATTKYQGSFQNGQKHGRGCLWDVLSSTNNEDTMVLLRDGWWYHDEPYDKEVEEPAMTAHTDVVVVVVSEPQPMTDAAGRRGRYQGILQNGVPQGVGTMVYDNDDDDDDNNDNDNDDLPLFDEYEGFWDQGRHHGYGRLQCSNGDCFEGNFQRNVAQGSGRYTTNSDSANTNDGAVVYQGHFHQGVFQSQHNNNQSTMKQQQQSVSYSNGDLYQGGYQNGVRYGMGKTEFAKTGEFYEGEFQEGLYHGTGTLVLEDVLYRGHFAKGIFHGAGSLVDCKTNDIIYQGEWSNGEPLGHKTMEDGFSLDRLSIPSPPKDARFVVGMVAPPLYSKSKATKSIIADSLDSGSGLSALETTDDVPTTSETSSWASSFFAAFLGPTKSTTRITAPANTLKKKEDSCLPVVNKAVCDGQGSPGRYTGLLSTESQLPHGVGRIVYDDGQRIHEGFWVQGHRQGHGRCVFLTTGDVHEGNYHQNLRQGPGAYRWKDGRKYNGNYHQDERHGFGHFEYPDGNVYEGQFVQGQRQGQGSFVFGSNKGRYDGSWTDGVYHGHGRLEWLNEKRGGTISVLEGMFSNGDFVDPDDADDSKEATEEAICSN